MFITPFENLNPMGSRYSKCGGSCVVCERKRGKGCKKQTRRNALSPIGIIT